MTAATTQDRTIVIERDFAHPPEKVWRALTQGVLMEEWLMKNDFKPIVGHHFQFRGQPVAHWDGVVDAEVLEVEPHSRLSYTWNVGTDAAKGMRTVVTYTLTATKEGTRLRMEHAGFREDQAQNAKGAQYGWGLFLGKLEAVVARA